MRVGDARARASFREESRGRDANDEIETSLARDKKVDAAGRAHGAGVESRV